MIPNYPKYCAYCGTPLPKQWEELGILAKLCGLDFCVKEALMRDEDELFDDLAKAHRDYWLAMADVHDYHAMAQFPLGMLPLHPSTYADLVNVALESANRAKKTIERLLNETRH